MLWRSILFALLAATSINAQLPLTQPQTQPITQPETGPPIVVGDAATEFIIIGDGDDYASIANNAALNMGTSDFAAGGWIKPADVGAGFMAFISSGAGASGEGYRLYTGNGVVTTRIDTGPVVRVGAHAVVLTVDTWIHVIITYDRDGNAELYLNNVAQTSGTFPLDISAAAASLDNADVFTLLATSITPTQPWNGSVFNLFIMNRLPTVDERADLYLSLVPSNDGLVALWNGPGTGTTIVDAVSGLNLAFAAPTNDPEWGAGVTSVGVGGPISWLHLFDELNALRMAGLLREILTQ